MQNKSVFLLIDSNALIHRAFHAVPPFKTKDGILVGAVYGFTSTLLKAIEDIKPTHIAAAFDLAGPTFRHEEFQDYKATRVAAPDELYEQIPLVKKLITAMAIPIFEKQGFEADDLIGTLCKKIDDENKNIDTVILTGDMDALQLVDKNTRVYGLKKGINEQIIYTPETVIDKYGFGPDRIVDYKALRGDPSDNIPGVRGVGEKTATQLIQQYGSLDKIYAAIDSGAFEGSQKQKEMLIADRDNAMMSYRLATINTTVDIDLDISQSILEDFDYDKAVKVFQEFEFRSLMPKLSKIINSKKSSSVSHSLFEKNNTDIKNKENKNYHLISNLVDFNRLIADLSKQDIFCFDTETTGLSPLDSELVGVSFSWESGVAYYVPVGHRTGTNIPGEYFREKIKPIFESQEKKKIGHNIKFDALSLKSFGIEMKGFYFDTMIASYLTDQSRRGHSLSDLSFIELGHQMIPIEELIGVGKKQISFADVEIEKACVYSAEDADVTFRIYEILSKRIKLDHDIENIFFHMEMPMVAILAEMESKGIRLDTAVLKKINEEVSKNIHTLGSRIIELAGEDFNINSTQQLGGILFNKLKIENSEIKKTKTGLSTAAGELEKLKGLHPIIDPILEYRELVKLKNTYLDALPSLVSKKDGRIHTSYNQTIASTGRLSSSDPNLQNIPIRTKIGQKVRGAFVASTGNVLLSCDYSQIELRVVASISGDEKMIQAFRNNRDIHTETASAVFGVDPEKVTKDHRRVAKVVNFGIIYGMSAFGLSQAIEMSQADSKRFIDQYFIQFPGVKKYMDDTLNFAREHGYVETLMGRKRFLPDIRSGVAQAKKAAERMAINMPVQGTAADIMKQAMIDLDRDFLQDHQDAQMLLQVHDELVFEVPESKSDEYATAIKSIMEKAYALKCPLEVSYKIGKSWDM